nr:hypothetical protein Itr_chr08CG09540 [Ipomoea trifida]
MPHGWGVAGRTWCNQRALEAKDHRVRQRPKWRAPGPLVADMPYSGRIRHLLAAGTPYLDPIPLVSYPIHHGPRMVL